MTNASRSGVDTRARRLLFAGAVAGPLYVGVALVQILTRDGFDVRRHAVSLLSNGEWGWIQVGNFLVTGVLVIVGAIGLRLCLREGLGRTWGPILLAVYGVGLIGGGIFVADPGAGFPPGTLESGDGMSRSGFLHFLFGGIGFYAFIAACFVFARRFHASGRTPMAAWSGLTGVLFFGAFAAVASGSTAPAALLALYAAVLLAWAWHTALFVSRVQRSL